jgi:hypothetical protein
MDKEFKIFLSKLKEKTKLGAKKHKHVVPSALGCIDEIEMELLDICGWGFLLWKRLMQLKKALNKIK